MNFRNIWLVIRREYLERVRTKAFVISTLLVPFIMVAVTIGPSKLASMKVSGTRKIVVVTDDAKFGETVRTQLQSSSERKTTVTIDTNTSPEERDALRARVTKSEIDGFLWATSADIADRKGVYTGREVGDFMEVAGLQKALTFAAIERRMAARGIAGADVDALLKNIHVDTVRLQRGKESKVSGVGAFLASFTMVFALYMTLIIYGITVMRSVIEEKSTRIVEVLLATIQPIDLMVGKIVGVGAVGLTQVLIWAIGGFVFTSPALLTAKSMLGADVQVPVTTLVLFPFYFLLGFLLYSASFAAVGAAVNSEQEAQQFNFVVMSPIIISMMVMMYIIRQPSAPWSVALSLFPFTAPICMFLRISVLQPPMWQIAASIVLMAVAVFVMMWLCARIYRIGILMYGKRPTLPEILKWMRYA
jgi:ABC-2 type transport system permease protein